MGTAMLTIMAAFAQLERDTMIERTRAGLAAAAANGRKGGRPRKVDDADAAKARQLREKGIGATDIAKMFGVSRATSPRTAPPETCGAAAPCSTPIRPPLARRMKANGETAATICETLGLGRTTLYRYLDASH
jgi:DNA invertase Pin-like site-specific DNA recombinase